MKAYIIKGLIWFALFSLLYLNVGFWSLVLDVRENNRLDREIKREEKNKESQKKII